MLRRSLPILSKKGGRTIVRDPRKKRLTSIPPEQQTGVVPSVPEQQQLANRPPALPFEPSQQNQQSVGSTLGSYVLMGAGVSIGFVLVGALFGVG
mmetsp:Transcript_22225/g.26776  ORF Transcript_22225/g.26776 Transcript_22225/m.26776 type:complete len:95 (-) Transcript_22225:119-403(-)